MLGGFSGGEFLNDVQVAPILADGRLGPWSETTPFPIQRFALASVAVNGYLYVLGGANDTIRETADVSFAPIHPDGTIGAWQSTTPLPVPRETFSVALHDGRLYVTGGNYSAAGINLQDVQMTTFNADGSVAAWTALTALPDPMTGTSTVAAQGHLYVLGGGVTGMPHNDNVLRAPINVDGTIGPWTLLATPLATPRAGNASVVIGSRLFTLGGTTNGAPLGDMYAASLPDLTAWVPQPPLPSPRFFIPSVTVGGRIYLIGGADGASTIFDDVYVLTPSSP